MWCYFFNEGSLGQWRGFRAWVWSSRAEIEGMSHGGLQGRGIHPSIHSELTTHFPPAGIQRSGIHTQFLRRGNYFLSLVTHWALTWTWVLRISIFQYTVFIKICKGRIHLGLGPWTGWKYWCSKCNKNINVLNSYSIVCRERIYMLVLTMSD